MADIEIKVDELKKEMENAISSGKASAEDVRLFKERLDELEGSVVKTHGSSEKYRESVSELRGVLSKLNDDTKIASKSTKSLADDFPFLFRVSDAFEPSEK